MSADIWVSVVFSIIILVVLGVFIHQVMTKFDLIDETIEEYSITENLEEVKSLIENKFKEIDEMLNVEDIDEADQAKQLEHLTDVVAEKVRNSLSEELDKVSRAINGSLGASTKMQLASQRAVTKEDRDHLWETMQDMIPGLEIMLDQFGLTKAVKKRPDKIIETIKLADVFTQGRASQLIATIQTKFTELQTGPSPNNKPAAQSLSFLK